MLHSVKNVFIAGGTGLLGYHTALKFKEKGVNVDTIALPNEIDVAGWFPKDIGLEYGDLFEMSQREVEILLSKKKYDTFVYALGPDDRCVPTGSAYKFFYEKLVVQCRKICMAAKNVGITRCVILNSYFAYFDEALNGKLSKYHPYIRARIEQAQQLINIGKSEVFDVMILQIPYVFGTMINRKPLWKDSFFVHYNKFKKVIMPKGGGTSVVCAQDVAEAVVACAYNGKHSRKYAVGNRNMLFKELVPLMLKESGDSREYKEYPACLCSLGARPIIRSYKKQGKENGLNACKLMTQIQNKPFFVDPEVTRRELNYKELGYMQYNNVYQAISDSMKACYPERFKK